MALDAAVNFAKVAASTGYDASATSIVLVSGGGARLATPPFNMTWWNSTDYPDPSDDPNREIVRCTAKASETLTVTRAQESTSASVKNLAGKTYSLIAGLTAKTINVDLPATYIAGSLTATRIPFSSGAHTLSDSADLTWDGSILKLSNGFHFGPPESELPDLLRGYFISPNLIVAAASVDGSGSGLVIEAERLEGLAIAIQGPDSIGFSGPIGVTAEVYAGASVNRLYGYSTYGDANGFDIQKAVGLYNYSYSQSGGTTTTYATVWSEDQVNAAANPYLIWGNGRAVRRIKFEPDGNMTDRWYNVDFEKYAPGADDYEALEIGRWTGGVVDVGPVVGDGSSDGVLRSMRLTGASVSVVGNLSAANLVGTNTGDQDLSSYLLSATASSTYVPLTLTVNGSPLSSNVTVSTITGNAGTATAWATPRNLAGNSVDGSANVAFANKFIVQGTTDAGLSGAQFLGALGTGIVKNTTTTGVLSVAIAADFPTLNQNTSGLAATATALATARTINGVNFDGTGAITVTAAAGTLSGATLASGVTASSLTSFGVAPSLGAATATSIAATGGFTTTQAISATSTDGLLLTNTTAATVGAQKFSPRVHFTGQGWKTTATAGSQTVDFIEELQPVQGATNPTANLVWSSQISGAGYNARMTLSDTGGLILASGLTLSNDLVGTYLYSRNGANYVAVLGQVGSSGTIYANSSGSIGFYSTTSYGGSADTFASRDGAGIWAQKNGAVAQEHRIYGTTTGSKYLSLKHDGTNPIIGSSSGGLKADSTAITPASSGTRYLIIDTAGNITSSASVPVGT